MIRVGVANPPYRPCPECGGSGSMNEDEINHRTSHEAKRPSSRDPVTGWGMILFGMMLLAALDKAQETSPMTAWIIIGIVIAVVVAGGKKI